MRRLLDMLPCFSAQHCSMGTWATLVILSRSRRVSETVTVFRSSFVPQVLPVTENVQTTRQESVLVTSAPLHDALQRPFRSPPSIGSAALSLSGPCPNNRSLPFRPSWLCGDPSRQDPAEQLEASRSASTSLGDTKSHQCLLPFVKL